MADGRTVFSWRLAGLGECPVRSSAGIEVRPQITLPGIAKSDNLVLLAGTHPDSADTAVLNAWLQRLSRSGSHITAAGAGCLVLAEAGLLDGRDVSAHWSMRPAWEEIHHAIFFNDRIFSVGDRVLTCCGGRGSIDLALHCVARHCSSQIAKAVGDQLNCDRVRDSCDRQTPASSLQTRAWNAPLQRAIALMEQNLEQPLNAVEISRAIKIGQRQLQRLFKQFADCTPNRYYLNRRLDRARTLLRQVAMSVTEVSVASGFTSSSHFTKCYKQRFGIRPSADRQANI
jgi:transcriptional regulator GlxA family with amidase domain